MTSLVTGAVRRLPFSDRILDHVNKVMTAAPPPVVPLQINEVAIPASPAQKIRRRILEKRCVDCSEESVASEQTALSEAEENSSEATLRDLTGDNLRDPVVEQFLEEQNDEFKVLINRNMNEVIRQQKAFSGEASWARLLIELSMANSTEEVSQRVAKLVRKVGDTIPSSVPMIRRSPKSSKFMESYNDPAKKDEAIALLDGLSYESKVALLRQLMVDLGMRPEGQDLSHHIQTPAFADSSALEKVEHMSVLLLRLWFIGIRHSIPIMKMAYEKFRDNEVFLLNHKNLDASLAVLIRALAGLEKSCNSATESQNKSQV